MLLLALDERTKREHYFGLGKRLSNLLIVWGDCAASCPMMRMPE
jgi:hypothetical protein